MPHSLASLHLSAHCGGVREDGAEKPPQQGTLTGRPFSVNSAKNATCGHGAMSNAAIG